MKIVFLFPHFLSPGGAANVALQFASALSANNHDVEICCAKVSAEFKASWPGLKFRELEVPASSSLRYWLFFPFWQKKIHHVLNSYGPCILFPHVLPSNWWAWVYKRSHKAAKVVWYCHEPSAFIHSRAWINALPVPYMKWGAKLMNPVLKKLDLALEKQNNAVICNSRFTKYEYEKIYGRTADAVIYPPQTVQGTRAVTNKGNTILTVGRLSRFKNIDRLINVFKSMAREVSASKLVIVGEGEEDGRLRQLSAGTGLEHRIVFTGTISNEQLAEYYRQAKVTVICSRNEPFGMVPVESMLHGTPVIAHNSGGPLETVCHGETGFLYNDEEGLQHFIKEILAMDESRYVQMQQSCAELVRRYHISHSARQLEEVLSAVAGA